MIKTREELEYYIKTDMSRYIARKSWLHYYFFGDESFAIRRFLKRWRKTEYYFNTLNKRNPYKVIRFILSFFIYRRMQLKYSIFLPLNVIGPGLYISHRGGGVIVNAIRVGKNFSISTGCILGMKGTKENRPIIGDNVECCIGAKVIGNVEVGDNVIIAPNSVVVKDIPAGDVVSGIPAKSIKR